MTCQHCQGLAHLIGSPCWSCSALGQVPASPVAPSVVADRLRERAEVYHTYGGIACLQQAAFSRAAAIEAMGTAHPSTRDAEALRGLREAAAAGMDLEAYAALIVRHITERGREVIGRWLVAHRTDSVRGAARALEVIRG